MEIFQCSTIGVAGLTDVHVKLHLSGVYEARMGITIMGMQNMTDKELDACDRNPFHAAFCENFAVGLGTTRDIAVQLMKEDCQRTSQMIMDF